MIIWNRISRVPQVDSMGHTLKPKLEKRDMNAYSAALVALIAPLSLCLAAASAQSQPNAAIVTGEVHNSPSREIEFRHEPLLAPGPSNTTSSWTSKTALPCS